ncbi:hypothetical protein FQA39_LY14850 [Lamprigera yunnana]|nr:hypothetical protein FQA39_LY14850 [Lamprigera yunnana]
MKVLYLAIIIPMLFTSSVAHECKGCATLDEYNFEKITSKFKASLIKFDVAYPYGDKHTVFTQLSEELAISKDILVAQVGIKDYGDKANEELAKKYGIKNRDDLPVMVMLRADKKDPTFYSDDWTIDNLRTFVKKTSNIYIGLPGCLEKYDEIASNFLASSDKKSEIMQAEKQLERETAEDKLIAETYVKYMKKIVEQPYFVTPEISRLTKIIKEGKINTVFSGCILLIASDKVMRSNDKDLKLLHIVYRHGLRTPVDTYPNDPYKNYTFFPIGWGQLTDEGKVNLHEHGLYLRKRYGTFLGKLYKPDLYHAETTDVTRAKVSAQCINEGLWPRCNQTIPIHSIPLDSDNLLLVRKPCPQYHIELERLMTTKEIRKKLEENSILFEGLAEHTGKVIKDFEDVQDIYTTLMAEEAYGLQLPSWTKDFYPNQMTEATIFSYVLNSYNDKLNRLKGGVFIKKLIEDWKLTMNGTLQPKAFLYVGHDSTIVNILSALKLWTPQIPNFSCNIFVEFSYNHSIDQYGVEIFFRNTVDAHAEPQQLKLPGCDYFCAFDKFVEVTRAIVPMDWESECCSNSSTYVSPPLKGP